MVAWAATWAVLTVVAFAGLLRASGEPEPSVKNGYRWFGAAALCIAVGAIVQQAFGGLAGGAQPLRVADLISLAALPALAIGLATLTSGLGPGDHGAEGGAGHTGTARGMVLDSCLLVSALFVVLLVTLFGPDYVPAEIGRAAFALALIRPAADLIALGLVLRFFVRSFRMTALPVLALIAIIVADSLAVADRAAGHVPGLGAQIAVTAALVLLAFRPAGALVSAPRTRTRFARSDRSWSSPATVAALAATAVAAIVVTAFAIAGRPLLATPARGRRFGRRAAAGRPAGGLDPACFCGR